MEIINDFNTSVKKALEEIDPDYLKYKGLVICGTHNHPEYQSSIDNQHPFLIKFLNYAKSKIL